MLFTDKIPIRYNYTHSMLIIKKVSTFNSKYNVNIEVQFFLMYPIPRYDWYLIDSFLLINQKKKKKIIRVSILYDLKKELALS